MKIEVSSDQFTVGDQEIGIDRFYLVKFTSQFIKLQIDFTQPESITLDNNSPDELEISIIDNFLFQAVEGIKKVPKNTRFTE